MSNNIPNAATLLEFANLQIAAEALYGNKNVNNQKIEEFDLRKGNNHSSRFTDTQAKEFAGKWEIVSHIANTGTGFSGTLFKAVHAIDDTDIQAGDLVISFRSTEFIDDAVRDNRATNTFEIKEKGWAFGQIADMEKWVQSDAVQKAIKEAGGQLNVTGYSLGGHLATAFNILHRSEDLIKSTYTFNGAGVGFAKGNVEMTQDKLRETMTYFNNIKNNESNSREHLLNHSVLISDDIGNRKEYSLKSIYENAQNLLSQSLISSNDEKEIALYHQNAKTLKENLSEILTDFRNSKNIHMSDTANVGFYNGLQYLHSAVNRISELLNEYNRLSTLSSGKGGNPNKVQASYIDALQLNYQIAVSATADKYTSALSFGGGVVNVIDDAAILDKREIRKAQEKSQIDNFYNVWAETKPSMVAVSQVHYGKNDVLVNIEDQPLVRGDYFSLVAKETKKQTDSLKDLIDFQLLVPNYANNDFGDTHSLVLIVDSLSVQNAMSILDKSFTADKFNEIMAAVTNDTGVSDGEQGKADGLALETITQALSKIVLNKEQDGLLDEKLLSGNTWHDMDSRNKLHNALNEIVGKKENSEEKTNAEKYKIESLAIMNKDDITAKAKEDNSMGLAYRYALQELNPFVVTSSEESHTIAAYEKENLKLYHPDTNHNGMTETYIEQRANMLIWKNAFGHANISFDDELGSINLTQLQEKLLAVSGQASTAAILAMIPANINGDWTYEDKASGLSFHVDGINPTELSNHYVRFGVNNDDILNGSNLKDYLFGDAGNDILNGGQGNDYMEGGADSDVYIIEGQDTILDNDGLGLIQFANQERPLGLFRQTSKNSSSWKSVGGDGEIDNKFIAFKVSNDLIVYQTLGNDSVIIKDYFIGDKTDALGISLQKYQEYKPKKFNLLKGNQVPVPENESKTYDWDKTNWNYQTGKLNGATATKDFSDVIHATYENDIIYGFGGNNAIDGEGGNDIIYGGNGSELLVGGTGSDSIFGGKGNDYIASEGKLNWTNRFSEKDEWILPSHYDLARDKGPQWGAPALYIDKYNQNIDLIKVFFPKEASTILSLETDKAGQKGDYVSGGDGSDFIFGSHADDVIEGDDGHDLLYGMNGNDIIYGGNGMDILYGDDSRLVGLGHKDVLYGGAGDDTIYGNHNDDYLFGEVGDDTIYGDSLNGQDIGNDYIDDKSGSNTIFGGNGKDTIFTGDGEDVIYGGNKSNNALDDDDHISSGASNDFVVGNAGNDTIYGGSGSDFLVGGGESDYAIDGDDLIYGEDGADTLIGGIGSDTLYGGSGDDTLIGNEDDDYLYAGEGADNLYGGKGDDVLDSGRNGIKGHLNIGNAMVTLYNRATTLSGDEGNDTLIIHDSCIVTGGSGNDTYKLNGIGLIDGIHVDIMSDIEGKNDQIVLKNVDFEQISADLKNGNLILSVNNSSISIQNYSQIENIIFKNNQFYSIKALVKLKHKNNLKNNTIKYGSESNDDLYIKKDNNVIVGGKGNDSYIVSEQNQSITIIDNTSLDNKPESNELILKKLSLNQIKFTKFENDLILVSKEDDTIITIDGYFNEKASSYKSISHIKFSDNTILSNEFFESKLTNGATEFADYLIASSENHVLKGLDGNDLLKGHQGDDILEGGYGNDVLIGLLGNNHYIFEKNFGHDVIQTTFLHITESEKSALKKVNENILEYTNFSGLKAEDTGISKLHNIIHLKEMDYRDLTIFKQDDNLIIKQDEKNDITIENFFVSINYYDFIFKNENLVKGGEIYLLLGPTSNNDTLYSSFYNNFNLNGLIGNDILNGSIELDTFIFSNNWGQDTIKGKGNNDIIKFESINPSSLKLYRDQSDLIIKQQNSENSIRVTNQFTDEGKNTVSNHIAQIFFDDGIIWDAAQIKAASVIGDNSNETITGFYDDDIMIGNGGNDVLNGQLGRDTYVFAPNWGVDTITDKDSDSIIRFNQIKPSDIRLIREGNSLIVMRTDSNDRITVAEHFKNETERTTHNRIAQIVFDDGTVWDAAAIKQQVLTGTDSEDVLSNSFVEGGTLYGLAGDDRLYGGSQQDTLMGGEGADNLWGYDGDDRLVGGEGNDELNGGSGSDTFVFAKGWGQDIIQAQYNQSNQDMDVIVFTDVHADEVLLRYEDGQLVLRRLNSNDQITVSGQSDEVPTIKQITFADGTTWSAQDIHLNALKGTDAADTITAIHATDEIYGGLGDDVLNGIDGDGQNRLFGEEGDDALTGSGLLDGGDGNDTLTGAGTLNGGMGQDKLTGYGTLLGGLDDDHLILDIGVNSMLPFNVAVLDGGEGNDVLDASGIAPYFAEANAATLLPTPPDLSDPYTSVFTLRGGKGNDVLYGSASADVYEFNLGDGHDTLIERKPNEAWMNTQVSYDAIHFGVDIRFGEIEFVRQGNDLILRHQNGLDSITVKEHFNSTNQAANHFKIDEVRFADGTVLTYAQIDEKAVWQGTDASEQMMGYRNISDTILAGAGNDQIFAQAGHDVVDGQAGNDYLDGGEGNDTLYGGSGDDRLIGGLGNDSLNGGAGNDTYLYGKNGGQDILDLSGGGTDTLYFMDGITRAQMGFKREGNDLLITVDNDINQSVRVKDHFLGGEKAISRVAPNGGVVISANEINRLVGNTGTIVQPTTPVKPTTPTQPAPITGTGQIKGTDGSDTLTGSKTSNDVMQGFKGNDTYVYTGGSDTIMETGGIDTLLFAGGIAFNQVSSGLMKSGNDLVLRVNKSNQNKVTLKDFFKGGANIVETIRFETGGSLNAKQIFELFKVPMTNPESPYARTVNGTERDDINLIGTADNELIRGLAGNDTLNGLAGNDHLVGGTGNDTYVFTPGFGQDTIDNTGGGFDRILFDGIDFNQVGSGLTRMNDDLILKVSGSDDQVTQTNWFKGGEHVVQQIDFASGGQITSSQLFQIFGMNDLTPPANADTASRSHARLFSAAQSMTQAMSSFGGMGDSGSNASATLNSTAHQPWTYLTSSV